MIIVKGLRDGDECLVVKPGKVDPQNFGTNAAGKRFNLGTRHGGAPAQKSTTNSQNDRTTTFRRPCNAAKSDLSHRPRQSLP
jgi:hypothetical protein